jgi:RNA polymerase sigma-70 factor (ECF subfamily)
MLTLIHRLRSDEALMQAYQRGDASAFECLYHRHKDGLFAFLYRSLPRTDVVEELAQEAWAAVVSRAVDYRPEAQFKTWLYQIARNRLADYWRRRDNSHLPLEIAPEPVLTERSDPGEELGEVLLKYIGKLPLEQRDALLLQQQGFSQQDIAAITGAGEETVKSRLRYARRQLREQLGELA